MYFRNQKGAAAIEFAIVLPLLVILVFGVIEVGLLLYNKQVITNASREGARAGITLTDPDLWDDASREVEIQTIVSDYCTNDDGNSILINLNGPDALDPDGNPANNIIVIPPDADAGNFDLSVEVRYDYNFFFGAILGLDSGITIRSRTVMRMESNWEP